MASESATKDPGGQQPEAFPGLDAAAKAGGMKPADQTERAIPASAPKDANLEDQEREAAVILNRNAQRDTGKAR